MAKTFVIGDIHGAYLALEQCLQRAAFSDEEDTLICLGDVSDGWPQTRECIDRLLRIRNLIYILGNHDFWTLNWMEYQEAEDVWLSQGGAATCQSYLAGVPDDHIGLLKNARSYYLNDNRLFVHAGILPGKRPEHSGLNILLWDRTLARTSFDLYQRGINVRLTEFDEVFLGHTPISSPTPLKCCEVWLMDTGAGWSGPLSMMDLDTKEFFISDPTPMLYPEAMGRRRLKT